MQPDHDRMRWHVRTRSIDSVSVCTRRPRTQKKPFISLNLQPRTKHRSGGRFSHKVHPTSAVVVASFVVAGVRI